MKKKTRCAVADMEAGELHDLYGKHEFKPIGEKNAIQVCAGCGSWHVELDRHSNSRAVGQTVKLLPRDFGDTGPFNLVKVMKLLSPAQQLSLATHLQKLGYGSKNETRRVEIEKYLNKGAAV